jgi:hypothetical protein
MAASAASIRGGSNVTDDSDTGQITEPNRVDATRSWLSHGFICSARGLGLCGPMLTQIAVVVVVLLVVALVPLVAGVYLLPGAVLAARRQADYSRQRISDFCGIDIPAHYRPFPKLDRQKVSLRRLYPWLLGDPATWRDLLWLVVNPTFGWIYTLLPGALVLWGLFGIVMPAVWQPIAAAHGNNWYAMVHVTSASSAWLSVPLGAAFVMFGLWAGSPVLRAYGRFAHAVLADPLDGQGRGLHQLTGRSHDPAPSSEPRAAYSSTIASTALGSFDNDHG